MMKLASAVGCAWLAVAALVSGGCANPSYVVLLDNGDGSVGKVLVTGNEGTTLLDKPRQGVGIGDPAEQSFDVSAAQINEDFGAALAASPARPISFLLYFDAGGASLTAESQAELPKIMAEIARRVAPDISVIGHTDTAGDDVANDALGMARAQFVASLITEAKLTEDKLSLESHGKKNLLVRTPDNTDEPRNRRVEVTIR